MINVIEGGSVTFDIRPYLQTRGWSIINGGMVHITGVSGDFEITSYTIVTGAEYDMSMDIVSISGGEVSVTVGGVMVIDSTNTSGYHQVNFVAEDSSNIKIWSNANTEIRNLTIQRKLTEDYEEQSERENTVTWSELRKGWVTFKDLLPESGFSMYTNLFTLKDGNLWIHSENAVPNLLYGRQKYSTVKFPLSSVGVKTYHSIALHSNKILGTTEDGITTELGNVSDLITYDFETSEGGIHYANKLRDQLLNERLKGRYIVVELSDEETKTQKLQLFKVVVKSEISSPNE
jgi:hypothetical protein